MKDVHHFRGRLAALALCLALVAGSATAAWAQARIEDCESIQAADAYNQCLAKFGPTSKVKSVGPVKPGDIKDNSAEAAAGAGPAKRTVMEKATGGGRRGHYRGRRGHGGGHAVSHRRSGRSSGGRKRMSFTVKQR